MGAGIRLKLVFGVVCSQICVIHLACEENTFRLHWQKRQKNTMWFVMVENVFDTELLDYLAGLQMVKY